MLLPQVSPDDRRGHIELCPEAGVLISELADRIAASGGFALVADYGHNGGKEDTFRVRAVL